MIPLLRCAELAQAVYSPPFTYEVEDVCFNVAQEGDDLAVVFQGTEDILEILRDVEACTTNYPGLGRIHNGVLHAALAAFPLIASIRPTAFIGHSLGGGEAIATCAIMALAFQDFRPRQLIALEPLMIACDDTLGGLLNPRVGQQILTEQGNDPVTRSPIRTNPLPYRHHTGLTEIGHPYMNPLDAHKIANVIEAVRAMSAP